MRIVRFLLLFALFFSLVEAALEPQLSKAIKYDQSGENRIGYIAIDDQEQISQSTWIRVKDALDYYKKNKPIFIILELNTPGGARCLRRRRFRMA